MNDYGDSRTFDDRGDVLVGHGGGGGMKSMERHVRVRFANEDGEMAITFQMAKFRTTRRTTKEVYGQYGDTPIVIRCEDYDEMIKQYQ